MTALPDLEAQGEQILIALREIPLVLVEEVPHLPLDMALEATATILYPAGIQQEEEAARVESLTRHGCARLGYGRERVLGPPHVPFTRRGSYLRPLPLPGAEVVCAVLAESAARSTCYTTRPYQLAHRDAVLERLALQLWEVPVSEARALRAEWRVLGRHLDEIAASQGWCVTETPPADHWPAHYGPAYVRQMEPDLSALREALRQALLRGMRRISHLHTLGLQAAFGSHVSSDPDSLLSCATWSALFDELGYRYDPGARDVEPRPLELPTDAAERVRRALERLPSYGSSEHGPLLCRTEVVQGVGEALGLPALDEAQAEALLTRGVVGRELVRRGYQTTALWVNGRHLAPAREGYDYYLPRVLSVPASPQRVMWAEGFRVHLPLLVRDGETVVYLELVGPRQAVHANWAALRTHNRVFHVAGARLSTCKEDGLTTLKATLPSGWDHWCLIHRQASCAQMTPGQPFYLVDLDLAPIPATFFPFLSHALSLPLLPGWTETLWVEGRLRGLVQPLSVGCIGAGGWRVHADDTAGWEALVSEGLREHLLPWEEAACLTQDQNSQSLRCV